MTTKTKKIERRTTNDFTVQDLASALSDGQTIDAPYIVNPLWDKQYEIYTAYRAKEIPIRYPDRYLVDTEGKWITGEETLVNMEDSDFYWGEGAPDYIHGIGHFETKTEWCHGDGHEMGILFQHKESGRFFMKTGMYSSWDSSTWDGPLLEVVPAEVKVIRFRPVDKPNAEPFDEPALNVE